MEIRVTDEYAYFAASNSAGGFYSDYEACFDHPRVQRVYAVKGGPGTGKSRFLRDVAVYAQQNGYQAEYIYCSSDPDSLDGVILYNGKRCMALLDATAPHVYEPKHPGVREEIINLGVFWNSALLEDQKEQINALNTKKSAAWRSAYRYLCGVGEMMKEKELLIAPYIDRGGLVRLAANLCKGVPRGTGYTARPALIRSVGMRGEVALQSRLMKSNHCFLIEDCHGAAAYLMAALRETAVRLDLRVLLSHDPILPDRIDGLFFEESGLAFVVNKQGCFDLAEKEHTTVRLRKYVRVAALKKLKPKINHAEGVRRAMMGGVLEALEEVKQAHFCLEDIYSSAMDFQQKEAFTKQFCKSLFDKV